MVQQLSRHGVSELNLRLISATVLMLIAATAIWAGGWYFGAFIVIASVVMCIEWVRICVSNSYLILTTSAVFSALAPLLAMKNYFSAAWLVLGIGTIVILAISRLPSWHTRIILALGIPYIGMAVISIVWLRNDPLIPLAILIWMIIVVTVTDSAGYFVGKNIGGPKLSPRISPKKTWSGFFGGLGAAAIVGLITVQVTGQGTFLQFTVLSVCLALTAQTGDLIESGLKRHFSVKDSGSLIPGHGGLLDRLDGFLLATPMLAILSRIVDDTPLT